MTVAELQVREGVTGFGGAGAHGGYVAQLALEALEPPTDRSVRSLVLHLLAPVMPGAIGVQARELRAGATMTILAADLVQDEQVRATAIATFGRSTAGIERRDLAMPDVPTPDTCQPLVDKPVPEALAGLAVEHRPAAGPLPLSGAERAEILVWMRFADERPLAPGAIAFLADSAPPALFATLHDYIAMPSTEITLHFARGAHAARSPWALGVVRHSFAADGYTSEDIELWTPAGELLAISHQLRRVLQ